jgi:uncharacterized protein YjbJ (UPF0337 family)
MRRGLVRGLSRKVAKVAPSIQRGFSMNKDQVEGSLDKAKGKVKAAVGKTVGNERLQSEGATDQAAGAIQKKVGDVKEAIKTVTKKP